MVCVLAIPPTFDKPSRMASPRESIEGLTTSIRRSQSPATTLQRTTYGNSQIFFAMSRLSTLPLSQRAKINARKS